MKPTFATKVSLIRPTVCRRVDCFADISTEEVLCTVTLKLDLDQMFERSILTQKDTNMIKLTFCCKFWVYSLPCADDCDDTRDIKWRLGNFRPPPWTLPRIISHISVGTFVSPRFPLFQSVHIPKFFLCSLE